MNINDLLYERLINPISKKVVNNQMKVGVELEYPIIRKNSKPIEKNVIEGLFKDFISKGFKPVYSNKNADLIGAQKNDEIIVTLDTSYNNLELAFAPQQSLNAIDKIWHKNITNINEYLTGHNYRLIDKGINPDINKINSTLIDDDEIFAECNFLESYAPQDFHGHKDLFAFISSSQTHLEIGLDKIPLALTTFSKLDFLETLLFANSELSTNEGYYYCGRHYIYSRSALKKANLVGSIDIELKSIDDVLELYAERSLFLRYRNKWEFFKPTSLRDYFGNYKFQAKKSDLDSFYSYCNTELKVYGTLERRGACSQNFSDVFAPSAFNIGIGMMLEEVALVINKFLYDNKIIFSNNELCELSAKRNFEWIALSKIEKLLEDILILAECGLKNRGFNEEKYLEKLKKYLYVKRTS